MKKIVYIGAIFLTLNAYADSAKFDVVEEGHVIIAEEFDEAPVIVIEEGVGGVGGDKFPAIVRPIKGEFDAGDIVDYKVIGSAKITSGFYTAENSGEDSIIISTSALEVEFEQSDEKLYFSVVNYALVGEDFTSITNYNQAKKACASLGQGWELIRADDMFALSFTGISSSLEGLQNLYLGDEPGVIISPAEPDSGYDNLTEEIDESDLSTLYGSFTPFWFAQNEWNDPTGTDNLQLFRHSVWDPSPTVSLSKFMEQLSASEKNDPGSLKSAYHRVALEILKLQGVPAICSNGSLQD